jgi:hypothetical protein
MFATSVKVFGCVGAVLLSLSLLFLQPADLDAVAGCSVAGGPNGHCCMCDELITQCQEVQHSAYQGCSGTFCSTEVCEWIE